MIRIAICDDQESITKALSQTISKAFEGLGEVAEVTCYQSGIALKKDIFSGAIFDAIFLDIGMPDSDGITVAKRLKEYNCNALIIFVSARESHVYESFAAQPFRFLRKSAFKSEIGQTVKDIAEALKPKDSDSILIHFRQSFTKVNPYEIVYIEAENKTTKVVFINREMHAHMTLTDFETLLNDFGFIKTHRSYLVNYRYIVTIQKEDLILENQMTVPISRHRLSEVKNTFQRLVLLDI